MIRIWNTEKSGPGKNIDGGRGRGRGKTLRADGEEGAEWSGEQQQAPARNKSGPWDDSAGPNSSGGDGLDLSDFAAMALKFRSEMENMKLNGEGEDAGPAEEDPMLLLEREQERRAGGIEDDEPMPDWATDEPAPQPAAKRSLLLEVRFTARRTSLLMLGCIVIIESSFVVMH